VSLRLATTVDFGFRFQKSIMERSMIWQEIL